jgi:hypothetical protein
MAKGDCFQPSAELRNVRYADDAVIGFQHEYEAKKFLQELREQLGKYGLELNEDKTRLIRFGRFARQNRDERGEGKPESFTFLGFRHVCAENRLGRFEVRRITDGDRRRKKLQEIKQQLRRKMHDPVAQVGGWLKSVLHGYTNTMQSRGIWGCYRDSEDRSPATGSMRWNSAAKGGPPGKSWGNYSITGFPCHMLFISIQTRAFTPAAVRRHIRSKNRVR